MTKKQNLLGEGGVDHAARMRDAQVYVVLLLKNGHLRFARTS
jgi:hypothetical protein